MEAISVFEKSYEKIQFGKKPDQLITGEKDGISARIEKPGLILVQDVVMVTMVKLLRATSRSVRGSSAVGFASKLVDLFRCRTVQNFIVTVDRVFAQLAPNVAKKGVDVVH